MNPFVSEQEACDDISPDSGLNMSSSAPKESAPPTTGGKHGSQTQRSEQRGTPKEEVPDFVVACYAVAFPFLP